MVMSQQLLHRLDKQPWCTIYNCNTLQRGNLPKIHGIAARALADAALTGDIKPKRRQPTHEYLLCPWPFLA